VPVADPATCMLPMHVALNVPDPDVPVNFHQAGERDGQTLLTVVRGHDDGKWQMRIVVLDTNGVEHGESSGKGTPSENNETWTYTFEVPLDFVFDPANHRLRMRRSGFTGEEVEFCDIPYGERNIWGATAGMLLTLYRLCVEPPRA